MSLLTHSGGRRAAFLDRDGIINVDYGYTFGIEELVFTPTAIDGVRLLNEAGYLVIVVTNQSGIARGLYTINDLERFHDAIQAELGAADARIDAFYYCAYHPEGTVTSFAREHEDRKPNPGMLLRAITDWSIERNGSFMIGDKDSDVEVARRVGIPGIRLPTNTCDLADAVRRIIGDDAARGMGPTAARGLASEE